MTTLLKSLTSKIMKKKRRTLLIAFTIAISTGLAIYASSNPGVAACAISDRNQKHSAIDQQLLTAARNRIQNIFGTPRSQPIVIFDHDPQAFWPLKNEYASTYFAGTKVCVMVGAKGQNTNVVAHELMHAEIADRIGYWERFTKLPVWFDEGLAMQVDFRPQYALPDGAEAKTEYVKALWSVSEFFVFDDALLTKNYTAAKAVVANWVADIGQASVYRQLERIRSGETFQAIIQAK
jgi:hypothetical protein